MRSINPGDTFKSRKGAEYVVVSVDAKGFTAERPSTGSQVIITFSKCKKDLARLEAGEGPLAFQANPSKGGISYTVAIEAGVAWALQLQATDKGWTL